MDKFWLVWGAEISMPIKKHSSFDAAFTEAKRLALQHPSVSFNVMESVGHHVKQEIRWEDHD